jgi:hypothetical protein
VHPAGHHAVGQRRAAIEAVGGDGAFAGATVAVGRALLAVDAATLGERAAAVVVVALNAASAAAVAVAIARLAGGTTAHRVGAKPCVTRAAAAVATELAGRADDRAWGRVAGATTFGRERRAAE